MRFCVSLGLISALIMSSMNLYAETISAIMIENTKVDEAYTENSHPEILENTWQAVCEALDLPIMSNRPELMACINSSGNPVYVQSGDVCSDGSFGITVGYNHCTKPYPSCPNSSWILSEDKKTCSRPDFSCIINPDVVPEEKLLAAIAYGESHWSNVYEEMAGITSAIIRRRDAAHLKTVSELVKENETFSYVVYNGNERFRKLMCGDERDFKKAYDAAINALNYGEDYSNGGCFWDGYDLKTSGVNHYKYRSGFKYSDPSHNIFSTPEPPYKSRKGRKKGFYDTTYISTITQGRTIFWKLDKQFLKANGAVQCN